MALDTNDIVVNTTLVKQGEIVPKCHGDTIDPGVNDDLSAGYDKGDFWVNTANDKSFVNVDNTNGASVWSEITVQSKTDSEIKTAYENNSNTNAFTDAQETKVNHLTVTQTVNLDTVEIDTATNNAKVSNVTHTSEVTGATALTVQAIAISNKTLDSTPAATAEVLINDAGTLFKTTVQDIADLGGGGAPSDMPGLQMKRTTDDALTTTPTNVTFDSTPFENDTAVIEHNNTNTDRMEIKETGAYLLGLNMNCDNSANTKRTLTLHLKVDDTTTVATLTFDLAKSANEVFARTIPVSLTAGTYITIDAAGDTNGDLTLKADSILWVIRMSGKTGATGAAGIAGADGDMTWEGDWVSQNYTANQAVKYTNGNSYVCKLDTVSSEVPTNATYWDVLAEKGDAGSAQSRIDISVHPHNNDKKGTVSATYVSQARFIWGGSTLLGTPSKIYSNCFQDAVGSGNVRIYDITNSQTIATSASVTSTSSGNIVDLGAISNISAGQAVWEIQNKGDGTNTNNISSISLEF